MVKVVIEAVIEVVVDVIIEATLKTYSTVRSVNSTAEGLRRASAAA